MAIAFVDGYAGSASGSATTIASTAQNHVAGNTIVVGISNYTAGGVAVSSIADTAGNTYSICGSTYGGDASHTMEIWVASNITGNASNVVTVTYAASAAFRVLNLGQWSGMSASPYSAASAGALTSSTTTHTTPTLTTLGADELLIGLFVDWAGGLTSLSSSSPSVMRTNDGSGSALADNQATTVGSYTVSLASGSSGSMAVMARSFSPASGGSAGSAIANTSAGARVANITAKHGRDSASLMAGARFTSVPLGSADEISGRGPSNLKSWLPSQNTPIAYFDVGGKRTPIYMEMPWYKFFQFVADIKLGGVNGPTLANVASDVVTAKAQASDAVIQQTAVTQQVQANAQALQAAVEVAQNAGLSGSDQIPPVSRTPTMIP